MEMDELDWDFKLDENLKEITANQFRDSGMLYYVNTLLQPLGMSIVQLGDRIFPALTQFRGFDESAVDRGCDRIYKYLKENLDQINAHR